MMAAASNDDRRLQRTRLRAEIRAARRALAPDQRAEAQAAIEAHLLSLPELQTASTVALYRAFDGEVATDEIARILAARDVTLLYARHRPRQPLQFIHAHPDDPDAWRWTTHGLPCPLGPVQPLPSGALILVPGVAFDAQGHRLGMGAGAYDRTLATADGVAVGLAYEIQTVPALPVAPWDRPVHLLVTEAGLRRFPSADPQIQHPEHDRES